MGAPMKISEHFDSIEIQCICGCGYEAVSPALLTGLELLRAALGKPVTVTSGCRCPAHNLAVGGAASSLHLRGMAADITVEGMSGEQLYEAARRIPQFRGFGVAVTFLHVDTRLHGTRWRYVNGKQAPWRA